jgi:hypothetical protein
MAELFVCEKRWRLDSDFQRADSREADPHAGVVLNDRHEGVVAVRAAHDDAGASKDMGRADGVRSAAGAARWTCSHESLLVNS